MRAFISRILVLTEIDNLNGGPDDKSGGDPIEWERLLLAGSILARSGRRAHQEAALRVATGAVTLETSSRIRDGAAILLDKLSNHRTIGLAERRSRLEPALEERLGLSMRITGAMRYKNSPHVARDASTVEFDARVAASF